MLRESRVCPSLVRHLVAMLVVLAAARPAFSQDGGFVRQHEGEQRNSLPGFSIAFADERRAFHPGELITLRFSFPRREIYYDNCDGLGLPDLVFERAEGVADPHSAFSPDDGARGAIEGVRRPCGIRCCGVPGGLPGDGLTEPPPFELRVHLNQAARFDQPGTYRFYVRLATTVFEADGVRTGTPWISNILQLTILERDPEWEDRTIADAVKVLDSTASRAEQDQAARVVAFLGTGRAVEEMARRYSPPHAGFGVSWSNSDRSWRRGLFAAGDRAHVVDRLEQELDRTDRFISTGFVADLATLAGARETANTPPDPAIGARFVRAYARRHFAALKAAGRLQGHLEHTFSGRGTHWSIGELDLARAYVDFPDDVEAAFVTLDGEQQRRLLSENRNWIFWRDPVFLPMLRRLTASTARPGPQDVALRLLYDLAPGEGRELALKALANPASPFTVVGLRVLPDETIPDLDDVLVRAFEAARSRDDYTRALERIERFASARLARRVRRAYERFPDARTCSLAPLAMAYFLRVDPAYAQTELPRALRALDGGERCADSLLLATARVRVSPALEDSAVGLLMRDPTRWAGHAAAMLRFYGTARAQGPLWRVMERWHEEWTNRTSKSAVAAVDADGGIPWPEMAVGVALLYGPGWRMDDDSMGRLQSLALTEDLKRQVEYELGAEKVKPKIGAIPPRLPLEEPRFIIWETSRTVLTSRDALGESLLLYPPGTSFRWHSVPDVWLPGEVASLFESARAVLERHTMSLESR